MVIYNVEYTTVLVSRMPSAQRTAVSGECSFAATSGKQIRHCADGCDHRVRSHDARAAPVGRGARPRLRTTFVWPNAVRTMTQAMHHDARSVCFTHVTHQRHCRSNTVEVVVVSKSVASAEQTALFCHRSGRVGRIWRLMRFQSCCRETRGDFSLPPGIP